MAHLPSKTELYLAIFNRSPVAMVVADDEGRFVEGNAAAEKIFDCKRDDLLGKKIADFVAPLREKPTERLWQDFQEEGRQEGHFIISRENGTDRKVRYMATSNILPGLHLSVLRDINGE